MATDRESNRNVQVRSTPSVQAGTASDRAQRNAETRAIRERIMTLLDKGNVTPTRKK